MGRSRSSTARSQLQEEATERMRWIRFAAFGLVLLALAAASGLAPGDSTRATIDHCYSYPVDWEPKTTKCTGHWTRLGHLFTGRVYGVDVKDDWQAIPPAPGPKGWYEVTVPEAARARAALAVPGAAQVNAGLVWTVRVALVLVAAVWVLLLVRAVTRHRLRQPMPG
jgi:hypothetical protein